MAVQPLADGEPFAVERSRLRIAARPCSRPSCAGCRQQSRVGRADRRRERSIPHAGSLRCVWSNGKMQCSRAATCAPATAPRVHSGGTEAARPLQVAQGGSTRRVPPGSVAAGGSAAPQSDIVDRPSSARTSHTLRSNAVSRMSRQLGAARFTSEMGRYLPVNILDSGRSGRLVRVCAEFQGSSAKFVGGFQSAAVDWLRKR